MYPELLQFDLPQLFNHFFAINQIIIYSYPFCILIGTILAYRYFIYIQRIKIGMAHLKLNLLLILFVMAYLGGKTFLFIDNPTERLPKLLSLDFYISSGFVFYGSFLFCLVSIVYILRKRRLPIFKYLDFIAIVTAIIHSLGRFGCFLAGCCYGKRTSSFLGVYFPKNEALAVHPTQLYEAIFIGILFVFLVKRIKYKNNGSVFNLYIFSYATWRFALEYLRGDERGYIFNNLLSHSQLISLILISSLSIFLILKQKHLKFTH